jgi:hypothetical protein
MVYLCLYLYYLFIDFQVAWLQTTSYLLHSYTVNVGHSALTFAALDMLHATICTSMFDIAYKCMNT